MGFGRIGRNLFRILYKRDDIRVAAISDIALVSPDLSQEMIVGAGTMQKWDISIINRNGHTEVTVGRDMHDPDIIEVD